MYAEAVLTATENYKLDNTDKKIGVRHVLCCFGKAKR